MKIAIIGGIGSGKSRALSILENYGFRVCDCDKIYRQVCDFDDFAQKIEREFGAVSRGKIDRAKLGKIVFSDKEKLKTLNALAHPYIFEKVDEIYKQDASHLFVEVSAFDMDMKDFFDAIIFVKSQRRERVERVKLRNSFEEEHILSIMSNQLSDEQMEEAADFVLINDGSIEDLEEQVNWLLQWLSK